MKRAPATSQADQASWPTPSPLEVDVAEFPTEVLPAPLKDAALTVARMLATPVDLPALAGLACTAAATRGRASVTIGPDWTVPVNVYTMSVAAPGEAKTPALHQMMAPLRDAEARLEVQGEAERRHQRVEHERAQAVFKQAERDMHNKPRDTEAVGLYEEALRGLDDHPLPAVPRLLVGHDATPEALVTVMHSQGGATSIITDEGAELFGIMGRYQSKQANTGIYLHGFDRQPYTRDRQGAPPVSIKRAWLTIFAAIQPGTLDTIKGDKNRQQGLLGRFLYAFPVSQVGFRPVGLDRPELDQAAIGRYALMLNGLIDGGGRELVVGEQARQVFDEWQHAHEPRLRPDGALHEIADWANKLDGQVLRLAGLLHLATGDPVDTIDLKTVEGAIRLGEYFVPHALKAFDQMDVTDEMTTARKLLNAIRRHLPEVKTDAVVSERDAYRWAKVSADAATQGFKVLEAYGWTRPITDQEYSGVGRPRSGTHSLNPCLLGGRS